MRRSMFNLSLVAVVAFGLVTSWVGGCTYAQDCPPTTICPEIEVECPASVVDCPHGETPPCPDCVCPGPVIKCPPTLYKVPVKIVPTSYRHLIRIEGGDRAASVGYSWNRDGRFKPSASVTWDGQADYSYDPYRSWYSFSVERSRVFATAGLTIGLGRR